MKLNLQSKRSKGFTLIELLVVIAIMATLAAIIFPKIANFGPDNDLKTIADSYVSVIRAAQAEAISGDLCGDTMNPQNVAYNWHFGTWDDHGSGKFYYHPHCMLSAPSVPEYLFPYSTNITISTINVFTTTGTKIQCSSASGNGFHKTEVSFDNITGIVHFENYLISPADPCDERSNPYDPECGYSPACPFTDKKYSYLQYIILSTANGHTYSVNVYKGGSVSEVKNF